VASEIAGEGAALALTGGWSANWLWGVPLIVLTVLVHAFGLLGICDRVLGPLAAVFGAGRSRSAFAWVLTVLLVTVLHAVEGGAWALAYVALGASPDPNVAMLYSLSAMTSYGHAYIFLAPHWQMMGALEALNGMMLFGLTTAFLFWVLSSHLPAHARADSRERSAGPERFPSLSS
jgi:hypothetical protein